MSDHTAAGNLDRSATTHPWTVAELRQRLDSVSERIPRRVLRILLLVGWTALAVGVLFHSRSLLSPLGRLGRPDPTWLTLAVVAEAASLVAYALIVRRLLGLGNVAARLGPLLRATLGGIAMSASLPGGQAASAAYWYRQLRKEGADSGLAAVAMVGSMLAGVLSLAALFVVGVTVAGGSGPMAVARVPILAAAGALIVLPIFLRRRLASTAASLRRRLAPQVPDGFSLGRRSVVRIAALACANWLFDCVCLYAALASVHAGVPLRGVLLTYVIAQLVASVPLLPGGGGTVEISLALGFAAFGHTTGSIVAGVLLFRLVSCWGLVPLGGLAFILDSRGIAALKSRRLRRPAPVAVG
jgi:putative heme transporter